MEEKVSYSKESYQDVEEFIQLSRSSEYPEIFHSFSELELRYIEKGINRCRLAAKKPLGASAICPMCEQIYYKDYVNQVFCSPKCRTSFSKNISRFKTKMRVNASLDINNPDYDSEERQEEALYMREDLENIAEEPFRRSADYYLARAARKIARSYKRSNRR